MKKLMLAIAIVGITGLAFGQQQASTATKGKDAKCSKQCMKDCKAGDKSCNKGACEKDSKGTTTSTATKK